MGAAIGRVHADVLFEKIQGIIKPAKTSTKPFLEPQCHLFIIEGQNRGFAAVVDYPSHIEVGMLGRVQLAREKVSCEGHCHLIFEHEVSRYAAMWTTGHFPVTILHGEYVEQLLTGRSTADETFQLRYLLKRIAGDNWLFNFSPNAERTAMNTPERVVLFKQLQVTMDGHFRNTKMVDYLNKAQTPLFFKPVKQLLSSLRCFHNQ